MNQLMEESFSNLLISKDSPKVRLENPVEETTLVSCEDDERCYENIAEKEVSDVDNEEARDTALPSPEDSTPEDSVEKSTVNGANEKEGFDADNEDAKDATLSSPKDSVENLTVNDENDNKNFAGQETNYQPMKSVTNVVAYGSEDQDGSKDQQGAEDRDDASVYTYGTNGTSESSVHDIISRLHSETQRRRKRLIKRRSGRKDSLQKYMSRAASDPVLGMTLDIAKIEE